MHNTELKRFLSEARNIINGYTYDLPEDVRIDVTTSVWVDRPNQTILVHEDAVSVLAWITIPKTYKFLTP